MPGSVIPAIIAARMRRYKEVFYAANALTPTTAIRLADKGLRESLVFHKLVRQGILVAVGDGRFYLDEERDEAVMHSKRKFLAVLVIISLGLLIIGIISAWKG